MAALRRFLAPQPTPAWRRLAGRAALAFGGLLLAEIVAWAAGAILLGRVDWRVATAGERELAGRAVEAAAPASSTDPTPALRGSEIVLHPYLGYVTDPAINRRSERRDALRVRNDGFFATQDELLPRSPGQVDVAIFGGSSPSCSASKVTTRCCARWPARRSLRAGAWRCTAARSAASSNRSRCSPSPIWRHSASATTW